MQHSPPIDHCQAPLRQVTSSLRPRGARAPPPLPYPPRRSARCGSRPAHRWSIARCRRTCCCTGSPARPAWRAGPSGLAPPIICSSKDVASRQALRICCCCSVMRARMRSLIRPSSFMDSSAWRLTIAHWSSNSVCMVPPVGNSRCISDAHCPSGGRQAPPDAACVLRHSREKALRCYTLAPSRACSE